MLRSLRTAALGMSSQQKSVDNTANNLANVNTTGFKRTSVAFQDLLYQAVRSGGEGEGSGRPAALQLGHGAAAVATVRNFSQGGLGETGNVLDLAIMGDGFLQVRKPDGTIAYTRDGSLTLDAEGTLVTQSGLPLEPDFEVPPDAVRIEITQDGRISVLMQGSPDAMELGQIELARFANPGGLSPLGGNLFEQTEASGEPMVGTPGQDGLGMIRQGYLEASNVDVVQEMVNLITAQRAYEINSKMVSVSEEMLQMANNLKR